MTMLDIFLRLLLVLPALVTAGVLALAAHEAGHVLGARLGGFTLRMFAAGPVKMLKDDRGDWHVQRASTLGEVGGFVIATPTRTQRLRRSAMLFAGGGPVASLILGIVAIAFYQVLGLGAYTWSTHGAWMAVSAGMFTLGVTSMGLAAVTGIPYVAAGLSSDGRRVLLLARGGPLAERHSAVMAMSGWFATGQSGAWDPVTVERALAAGDDGTLDAVMARYLAYLHALDTQDTADAGAHIGVLRDGVAVAPPSLRPVIYAEAAYYTAAYRGDARAARALLERATQSPVLDAHTRRRAEIAVLLAGEDPAAGRERLRELLADLAVSRNSFGSTFLIAELGRLSHEPWNG